MFRMSDGNSGHTHPPDGANYAEMMVFVASNFARLTAQFESIDRRLANVEQISERVVRIETSIQQSGKELDDHRGRLLKMERTEVDHAQHRKELHDHDARLAAMEKQLWIYAGVSTVIGASLGAGVPFLIQAIEHGESTHALLVYQSTLRVPFVMAGPGIPRGREIVMPVGTVDLLPTILAVLGLSAPEGLPGRDLGPVLQPGRGSTQPTYGESLFGRLNCRWSSLRR